MDYFELTIQITPRDPWAEVLVAELAELGFESFVDTEQGIQAYAPVSIGEGNILDSTSLARNEAVKLESTLKIIPYQNWNAVWEADFEPVEVDDRLVIIAPFHDQSAFTGKEQIIIQPQMSFGTGHHQTTYLMSQLMLDLPEMPERVLDMGTGTGVLAILAEKKGAGYVLAIDIEPWSVENTIENAARNKCTAIEALTGDIDLVSGSDFGLILANINKNVLKAHMSSYSAALKKGGILLLSGFFASDATELIALAEAAGLSSVETVEKETWAALKLIKK